MITKVQRWGNSLGVRIPKSFAEEAHVKEDSEVDLTVRNGRIVLRPVHPARYRLEDLLSEVTQENLHDAVDTGPPVGREQL
jgi:antitoxin MazE